MAGSGPPRSAVVTAVVAVLVTAGALVTVALLRPRAEDSSAAEPNSAPAASAPAQECGDAPCQVLATQNVNGTTVELLAGADGNDGRFRAYGPNSHVVIETKTTALGARLNQNSLQCVAGPVSACLVRGLNDGGMLGEVLVSRDNDWRSPEKPYFSDAGGLVLDPVAGAAPDVVVVKHQCPSGGETKCQSRPVYAEVFDLAGEQLGCTRDYTSPSQLRGWPAINLVQSDLRACPGS
ncbi:hypothetical protein [Amycolatopsis anabasis]|uniref:hypothetical protein n=1 Tax=Amycolatopsis anabasis TaxID=1840409 RepID=UPI00131B40EB|nr:hypothetical protein [Amycolatopsis anabasis]